MVAPERLFARGLSVSVCVHGCVCVWARELATLNTVCLCVTFRYAFRYFHGIYVGVALFAGSPCLTFGFSGGGAVLVLFSHSCGIAGRLSWFYRLYETADNKGT